MLMHYISGFIVGVIVLQTMVFAPTLFKTIEPAPAGKLLRALFPKFFRLLTLAGVVILVLCFVTDGTHWADYVCATITIAFPIICSAIIPMTNRARDAGNDLLFKRMHTLSVLLTVVVLLANIILPFV